MSAVPAAAAPRILALMGSGETAPTMAKVHRHLAGRAGPSPIPAVLLDTPYGFQENADEITAKALDYFRENVGMPITVASFRGAETDPLARAAALARLQDARYLFAGPGSPSYALAAWRDSGLGAVLLHKLSHGGIVVFASAASLTLGAATVPVYEIYKVGEAPRWLPGLDVLGRIGLDVAVIPHYDNAEGGSHDTRFCYLGERRLAQLEAEMPPGRFVLGIDSHTALLLDLDAGSASVQGLGGVTVRAAGRSERFPTGTTLPIADLATVAARLRAGGTPAGGTTAPAAVGTAASPGAEPAATAAGSLPAEVDACEAAFDAAVAARDIPAAIRAVLDLDTLLGAWSRDSAGTDAWTQGHATFQALIVRLGSLAPADASADAAVPDAVIALLVELRTAARAAKDWKLGDRIRDALTAAAVEIHDTPEGTTWERRPG
ncbi:MAG: hypothetical protein ACKOTZ_06535 [Chloroflexota bacterium]